MRGWQSRPMLPVSAVTCNSSFPTPISAQLTTDMTPSPPPDLPAIDGGTPVRELPLPFYTAPIDESDIEHVVEALLKVKSTKN